MNDILRTLIDETLRPHASWSLSDIRIGIRYTAVVVQNPSDVSQHCGLAATMIPETGLTDGRECYNLPRPCAGLTIGDLLPHLDVNEMLARSVLLATVNAVLEQEAIKNDSNHDPTLLKKDSLYSLLQGKSVAMIGLFRPMLPRLLQSVSSLAIMERDPRRRDEASNSTRILNRPDELTEFEAIIMTATTILNQTMETLLEFCSPHSVFLMGPSTPLAKELFRRYHPQVLMLSGRHVTDIETTLRIISEGGGTPDLAGVTTKIDCSLDPGFQ